MIVIARTLVLIGVSAALAACDQPTDAPNGAVQAASRPGGIGGTGLLGEVGALEGVVVAGVPVETDALDPAALDGVEIGSTLLIEASQVEGALSARSIRSYRPVVGPVLDVEPGALTVAGVTVRVDRDALDALGVPPRPGDWLAVSGLWRSDGVDASRLERVSADRDVALSGLFSATGERSGAIARVPIELACCAGPRAAPAYAEIEGRWRGDGVVASEARFGHELLFADVERLIVEGALAPNPDDDGAHLSGLGLAADVDGLAEPPALGERAVFVGAWDGAFRIETARAIAEP